MIVVCFFSNCCKGNTLLEPLGVKSWKAHCFQVVLGNYTNVANGWIIEINLNYIPRLESILSRPSLMLHLDLEVCPDSNIEDSVLSQHDWRDCRKQSQYSPRAG